MADRQTQRKGMSDRKSLLEQQLSELNELIHEYEVDEFHETDPLSRKRISRRLADLIQHRTDKIAEIQIIAATEQGELMVSAPARRPSLLSLGRMPSTGSNLFGRTKELAGLTDAWEEAETNVVVLVAWGGVGKTALVNSWISELRYANYLGADAVYAWSFYTQGVTERVTSADLFIESALRKFDDPHPTVGSSWEKGTRLAGLIRARRTLLIIDGLEPLQHPPGPDEGRIKDPSLIALFSELAESNTGLCLITTRLRIEDLSKFDKKSVVQKDLGNLTPKAGAHLLRASGVRGPENHLEAASVDFGGHALALTLLGSFLKIVHNGDIESKNRIVLLEESTREGRHARRVMASYEQWIQEQTGTPDLALLRLISLFDRPTDEAALKYLFDGPPIPDLTDRLSDIDTATFHYVVARLSAMRLLLEKSFGRTDEFDMHPLVREYFSERLRSEHPDAWHEGNRRLFHYYKGAVVHHPDNIQDMQYLFQAAIHGCKGKLYSEVLREIYVPRISRGEESYAATVLGASNALLSVLTYFFDNGDWGKPVDGLKDRDKLYVLMESGKYLTQTRGYAAAEVGQCYGRANEFEPMLASDGEQLEILLGLCRYSRVRGELNKSGSIASTILYLCQKIDHVDLYPLAYRALASNAYYMGDFEKANKYSLEGLSHRVTRAQATHNAILDINDPSISCLGYRALSLWFLGDSPQALIDSSEAISRARNLDHPHTLAITLLIGSMVYQFERDFSGVEKTTSELVSLCAERGFSLWRKAGEILLLWGQTMCGRKVRSNQKLIAGIIEEWLRTDAELFTPYWYGLLAECFLSTGSKKRAYSAANAGLLLSKKNSERWWDVELLRLRAESLRTVDGDRPSVIEPLGPALDLIKDVRS
jgi:hypothetical protein